MLQLETCLKLMAGSCSRDSRLLLSHAESLLRSYDEESMQFMRKRTIEELDQLAASMYPKHYKDRIKKLSEQLSVLDMILNHEEEGGNIL